MRIFKLFIFISIISLNANAQQKWNLKTIVDYAMANNIGIKLNEVQAKIADITTKQSKLSQYPNVSFTTNTGLNSGNNQDPTTFQRITQTYLNAGFQLQTSADIFNFFSKKNTIAANEWDSKAAIATIEKTKNDIALLAANSYLQILLSIEQEKITEVRIQQTQAQLNVTRKQVKAGALPELNATQLEAQLAQDSVNYFSAKGNTAVSIYQLKSYMNIDAGATFNVDTPPINKIPLEPIASLQPDYVYEMAIKNLPQQQVNEFKIKAAAKRVEVAKAAFYPTLSTYGSLGTSYIAANSPAYKAVIGAYQPNGQKVNVAGTDYFVTEPSFSLVKDGTSNSASFPKQVADNLQKSIGISIRVPIFNGGSQRSNYQISKLNINTLEYLKQQDNQKLKQDIYQAYNAVTIALEKFSASKKSVDINELSLSYASKRFNVGMLSTFDLITTQNNLLTAKLQYALNQFDYVFKMKVLEFYKGQGLRL